MSTGRPADHIVCRDGAGRVDWREFSGRVAALATQLAGRPERRWALCCRHPLQFAAALLAVWHTGGRPVLPPNFLAGTLEQLAGNFDGIVSDGERYSGFTVVEAPEAAGGHRDFAPLGPDTGLDLYTSGSSGAPKRIAKTLGQLEAEVAVQERLWGRTMGEATVIATVPHYHIYGLLFFSLLPVASGRPLDSALCTDPAMLLERLAVAGSAAIVSSPAMLSRLPELIELERLAPATRLILSSGGPLPETAARAFHQRLGWAPAEIYGSTETGGIAWRCQQGDAAWTPLPGHAVAVGEGGALRLRSAFLGHDDWVTLDDAAEMSADGRFILKGRLDRVVKIEEKRLSLPDMEARLRDHPWVADAGIVALPGATGSRQTIAAAVTLNAAGRRALAESGRRATGLDLRRHLAAWFEPLLLPRRWRFPEQLPTNDRGKLTADALAALFAEAADEPEDADLPA